MKGEPKAQPSRGDGQRGKARGLGKGRSGLETFRRSGSGLQSTALVLAIIGAHLNGIKIALSLYLLKRFVLTRLT